MNRKQILTSLLMAAVACASQFNANAQLKELPNLPPSEGVYCRCHSGGGCYGGNYISFRKKCAYISGAGYCGMYSSNCPR